MRLHQITEGRDAPLYHGVRFDHAAKQLKENRIEGRTTQRFWPGGRRLKDDHPEYKDSFWLKGVSLTRDINYAKHWADIVYVIDQTKLSQRYKIIPFNWGYANAKSRGQHHKREREEFVVLGKIYKSLHQFIEDYNDERDALWDKYDELLYRGQKEAAEKIKQQIRDMPNAMDAWQGPVKTNIEPLDQYLLEIRADKIHDRLNAKKFEIIKSHPKFAGFF